MVYCFIILGICTKLYFGSLQIHIICKKGIYIKKYFLEQRTKMDISYIFFNNFFSVEGWDVSFRSLYFLCQNCPFQSIPVQIKYIQKCSKIKLYGTPMFR